MSVSIIARPARNASASKAASLAAIALGAVFIYIVGFSPIEVVHNAAHDTRHSSAFPCH